MGCLKLSYGAPEALGKTAVFLRVSYGKNGSSEKIGTDYYPFGSVARRTNTPNSYFESPADTAKRDFGQFYRWGFQGQFSEEDPEINWNSFEARMYDPVVGRWMTIDPSRQFFSPYMGMSNNPIIAVDPDGRIVPLILGWAVRYAIKDFAKNFAFNYAFALSKEFLISGDYSKQGISNAIYNVDILDVSIDAAKDVFNVRFSKKLNKIKPVVATAFAEILKAEFDLKLEDGFDAKTDAKMALLDFTKGSLGAVAGTLGQALGGKAIAERIFNEQIAPKIADLALDFIFNNIENTVKDRSEKATSTTSNTTSGGDPRRPRFEN